MSDDTKVTENLDMADGRDRAAVRTAIKKRWPVSEKLKALLLSKTETALDGAADPRDIASLGRNILAAEAQNQSDDHLTDKNERIDEGKATESVTFAVEFPKPMRVDDE